MDEKKVMDVKKEGAVKDIAKIRKQLKSMRVLVGLFAIIVILLAFYIYRLREMTAYVYSNRQPIPRVILIRPNAIKNKKIRVLSNEKQKTISKVKKIANNNTKHSSPQNLAVNVITPEFQIIENAKEYIASIYIPNSGKDHISIKLHNNILTIAANVKDGNEIGEFVQSVSIPNDANIRAIRSYYKNGILTIVIPKIEQKNKNTRYIKIR